MTDHASPRSATSAPRERPASLAAVVRRRVFRMALRPAARQPYAPLVHLGPPAGGWTVPDDAIDAAWSCCCVGAGADGPFPRALAARYGAHVRTVVDGERRSGRGRAPGRNGAPHADVRSLPRLIREPRDGRVDLLALDIDGREYDLLPALELVDMGVRVLLVSLHPARGPLVARRLLDDLRRQGYLVVHRAAPARFTLVRLAELGRRGHGVAAPRL